jgi:hypothetical protein
MSSIEIMHINPNPAKTVVEIMLQAQYSTKVKISFSNEKNIELMRVPYLQDIQKGPNVISINVAPLKPGTYKLSISDDYGLCFSYLTIKRE